MHSCSIPWEFYMTNTNGVLENFPAEIGVISAGAPNQGENSSLAQQHQPPSSLPSQLESLLIFPGWERGGGRRKPQQRKA